MDRKRAFHLILWLYDWLVGLYPARFRAQFSAEQREVFIQALEDAPGAGAALRLLGREFADLPGVLARCYAAALRRGGWKTALAGAALAALFMVPAIENLSRAGPVSGPVLSGIFVVGLLISLLAGIVLGFPRWALPYLGFVLSMFSFYQSISMVERVLRTMPRRDMSMLPLVPRLAYGSIVPMLSLLLMLLITFVLFFLLGWIDPRRVPRLWRHTRRWSDASFLLYGGTVWLALLAMDEYQYNGPVIIPAVMVMLIGAVAYLRAPEPWRGVRGLLAAAVLAFLIITVGKYFIVPLQAENWPGWFAAHPVETERLFESLSSLLLLVWLVPALMIPAVWRPFIDRER